MTLGEANAPGDASEVLPTAGAVPASRTTWWERACLVVVFLLTGWFYVWTVRSSGDRWRFGREQKDYYNLLLDGWLDGHLYMKVAVPAALLKLDDPYDPKLRPAGLALHDASLYRGKYYLYFGAAPVAVLLLPFRLITGVDLPLPAAVLFFTYGGFLASTATFLALRRRYFADAAAVTVVLCVAVLATAALGPVLLRRPHMWELPISAGYGFAMLALFAVERSLHQRRRHAWFAAAALALGLAIASRPTYLLATPLLALPLLRGWRSERRWPWRAAVAAFLPLAVVGAAMAWHNFARFGNPLQFGQAYQLSLDYESKVTHFSARYLGFNTWRYFFSAAQWSPYFPFIQPADMPPKPPGFAGHDDVYGVLRNLPIAWLAFLAPLALWRRGREGRGTLATWLGATAVLFAVMAGVLLFFFGSLARYESDFTPALMLLAAVGVLAAERFVSTWSRPAVYVVVRPVWMALAAYAVVFGILYSLALDRLLAERNPAKAREVAALLNRVPAMAERLLGVSHGALTINLRLRPQTGGDRVLLTVGDPPNVARVFVRYEESGEVRVGFGQNGPPDVLSRPLAIDFNQPHQVRIRLGALLPPSTHPMFAGWAPEEVAARTREVSLAFDGESVLEERRRFDDNTGRLRIARDALASAETRFNGELLGLQRERVNQEAREAAAGAGFVRLRLQFPDTAATPREPLVALGAGGDDGLVFVHYIGDAGRVAFGYVGHGRPAVESAPMVLDVSRVHDVAIRWTGNGDANQRVVEIRVDGMIQFSRVLGWPARDGAIVVGQNVNEAPGCAARFSGRLTQTQRSADGRDPLASDGDTVRLRVRFPANRGGTRDPLLVRGRFGGGDLLMVEYVDAKRVRFALDHWGSGAIFSEPVAVDFTVPHDVEIRLGSLAVVGDALGWHVRRGAVRVSVDGGRVWEQETELFTVDRDEVWLGRNPIGGTNCGAAFGGDLLAAERLRAN